MAVVVSSNSSELTALVYLLIDHSVVGCQPNLSFPFYPPCPPCPSKKITAPDVYHPSPMELRVKGYHLQSQRQSRRSTT